MNHLDIADRLCKRLRKLRFGEPVTHVYNPLEYARETYAQYVERFGRGRREVVLLGMNPGPWGMAQTGVPFGEISAVRDWMGLTGRVNRPRGEHPRVPVMGFECHRAEVSGSRLWGWARDRFATPEAFFDRFFVANYCPLVFLEQSGRNRTPDKLPVAERTPLLEACDEALLATIELLRPEYVIGVGGFAAKRIRQCLNSNTDRHDDARHRARARGSAPDNRQRTQTLGEILHPSPASPAANRGWREQAEARLRSIGIKLPSNRRVARAPS